MKQMFCYILLATLVSACSRSPIRHASIAGELYAKNTVKVTFRQTKDVCYAYTWYTANHPEGEWTQLQGIHTPEIVLLTEYAGKYLICEITTIGKDSIRIPQTVISKTPVVDRGNPNTDWFKDAGLGLMIHFLKDGYTPEGGAKEWNDIVNGFDAALFAHQCHEAGVGFVLWALGQNDGYYNSPNAAYDEIAGVSPGELCSLRDLPADLIKALKPYNIRFMFYLPGNPPHSNPVSTPKYGYTYGKDTPTSQFTQQRLEKVIREWSLRYGKDLSGWWFDGMYRSGIIQTRSDMSLPYNISTHTLAAKAGNPQSIVSYNYGVDAIQSDSPYDDYSAGEKNDFGELPQSRWIIHGIQWFHFTYLGKWWSAPGVKTPTEELTAWAEKVFEREGVLCFDVHAFSDGHIDTSQVEQLKAIAQMLEKVRKNH